MQGMPNVRMAMDARHRLAVLIRRQHVVNKVGMTMQTGMLRHLAIARFNTQGIGIVVKCERQRMEEPVIRFGYPLADRIVREMAIVADRHVMMTRFLPGIVRLLHHMTVDTRFGVVTEITGPFAVTKRECP